MHKTTPGLPFTLLKPRLVFFSMYFDLDWLGAEVGGVMTGTGSFSWVGSGSGII